MILAPRTVLRALVSLCTAAVAFLAAFAVAKFGYDRTQAGKNILGWIVLYLALSLLLGALFLVWQLWEWIRTSAESEAIKYRKIRAPGGDNRPLEDK